MHARCVCGAGIPRRGAVSELVSFVVVRARAWHDGSKYLNDLVKQFFLNQF